MRNNAMYFITGSLVFCIMVFSCLLPSSSLAVVRYVPADYPTIQSAIDASSDGDEIIVSPGTYYENINFKGKNIILRSTDPTSPTLVASTIIDGNQAGSVVTFSGTESSNCVLSGFTITNGDSSFGGGINGNGSAATIQNNIIYGNIASLGGGIYDCDGIIQNNALFENSSKVDGGGIYYCDGLIQNNTINSNSAFGYGGGIGQCYGIIKNNIISDNSAFSGGGLFACEGTVQNNIIYGNFASKGGGGFYYCDGTIQNNTIYENNAKVGGGFSDCDGTIQNNIIYGNSAIEDGGGIYYCYAIIQNNTIYANSANQYGGGLYWCYGTIRNCIIWQNTASMGSQIYFFSIPTYSCIQDWTGGGTGNISLNPQLADPENRDFHLLADSPCIDAGCYISELLTDFEGNQRGYDGTSEPRGDGSDYDIGADEYVGIVPTPTETPTPIPTETPTPSPTETPTPTPAPTLTPTPTPTATPVPTLTPTPVPTDTPTPTPALPYFTFEENEEGWTFSGKILPFDEAAGNWESGRLNLTALGSTNCFGYWFSPDVAVEGGKLYRARWTVGSDASDPDKTVGFRLRINQRGSWAGWDRVVNSYLGQAPSAGNPKTYYLYFDPIVTGVNNDHLVIFSFDLTSFDMFDDVNSSLYLEELLIEEIDLQVPLK